MLASTNNKLDQKAAALDKIAAEKVVLETKSSEYLAQIANLSSKIEAVQSEQSSISAIKDKQIKELKAQLFEAQKANIFIAGSPYPVGLDKIRIGDPIKKIPDAYPYQNESKSSTRIVFKNPSDVFEWMIFEHSVEKDGVVEAISFDVGRLRKFGKNPKPELPDGWLDSALNRALGAPRYEMGSDRECSFWRIDNMDRLFVFHIKGDESYMITKEMAPAGCYFTKDQRKELGMKN
ncbi:hypothetical protein V6582_14950 [Agrobacterium vitis]|uniref:hypothetical protein n=1 Tax=Agrobacterium vitis TaxID=373 RepID=UPI0012E80720|nr:hypothetical protein [Agrobacterium vitis]MVA27043.1 hypothetical protein [Agrobacterium vitis]